MKKLCAFLCTALPIALIALTLIPMTGCSPTEVTGIFEAFFGENEAITETIKETESDIKYQEGFQKGQEDCGYRGYEDGINGVYDNPAAEKFLDTDAYWEGYCSGFTDAYQAGYYRARRERPDIEQFIDRTMQDKEQ